MNSVVDTVTRGKKLGFLDMPLSKPDASGVRRIKNNDVRRVFKDMNDLRVLWLVISHLGYKRRVGLLMFALVAYFALDNLNGLYNVVLIIQGTLFG